MSALAIACAVLLAGTALADQRPLPTPKPARGSPEEIVCRRELTTGTLARYQKFCATRGQWEGQSAEAQAQAGRLDEQGRINSTTQ